MDGSQTIEAVDVRKAYGEDAALAGVSLSVDAGEVFGLVGPNGAGKTTLVRCFTGTTTPDGGDVRLLGGSPRDADAERVGVLPQDFDPPGRLTAREVLAYYAGLYEESRDVEAIVETVGVGEVADTRYEDLSGGERRRTLVGSAIVNDPDVLFLDEPTTGIDPAGRRAVWGVIDELAAEGTTVFLTTHYMAEIERLADRVGVLVDGAIYALDSPGGLVATHGGAPELVISTGATSVPGYDAEPTDGGLKIQDVSPGEVGEIVETLQAADLDFDGLTWRDPDLETVYLDLTGGEADVEQRPDREEA